jgi:hypothetical protein
MRRIPVWYGLSLDCGDNVVNQTTLKKPLTTTNSAIMVGLLLGTIVLVTLLAVVSFNAMSISQRQEIVGGLHPGVPERHLIPNGYKGWIMVEHNATGEAALPMEEGVNVFRYLDSGVLRTSTRWSPGIKTKTYFIETEDGPVEVAKSGPNRQIWGNLDVTIRDVSNGPIVARRSCFFVGTRNEYKEAGRYSAQHGSYFE